MGKSTISMVIFNSYVSHNQAGYPRILPEMAYRIFFSVAHGFTDHGFNFHAVLVSTLKYQSIDKIDKGNLGWAV